MSYILILFVSGQAYLTFITAGIVLINYTLIFIGIYTRQGILTYVLVCQSLMGFFPVDEWLDRFRGVRLLFPTILATFAGLFLKPHYLDLTIALWFFMAGYELDMPGKLRQSFREVRNHLVHVGIIKTIKRLYKERQIGWTLKVFLLISLVNAIPCNYRPEVMANIFTTGSVIFRHITAIYDLYLARKTKSSNRTISSEWMTWFRQQF